MSELNLSTLAGMGTSFYLFIFSMKLFSSFNLALWYQRLHTNKLRCFYQLYSVFIVFSGFHV